MVLWTSKDAVAATGGRATQKFDATGVSIDTRSLQPGDLFVALKAARDGHDFVAQALEQGATAALVSHVPEGVAADAPLLIVGDVLSALERLGAAARARVHGRVVGVTGSVGKTTTKEMLRAVLSQQGKTHVAEASYNNHWGVPLTLARMPEDTEFAVIEIGMNHPGEIGPLARLARPDVALITTVAPAHMAAFESLEGIAREKAAIFDGLEPSGVAIFNSDIETTDLLRTRAAQHSDYVVPFGEMAEGGVKMRNVCVFADGTKAQVDIPQASALALTLSVPGRHYMQNAVAVIAVAQALGLDLGQAAQDLHGWRPYAGRGTREPVQLAVGAPVELIDDAFNANPASMAAALEILAKAEPHDTGRRIAILGDMLELGESERAIHAGLAALPWFAEVDAVHCVGPLMRTLYDMVPDERRGEWFECAEDALSTVGLLVNPGDVVLVKGSKGSKVSLLVDALRKLGQSAS